MEGERPRPWLEEVAQINGLKFLAALCLAWRFNGSGASEWCSVRGILQEQTYVATVL